MAETTEGVTLVINTQTGNTIPEQQTIVGLLERMEKDLAAIRVTGVATTDAMTAGHVRTAAATRLHAEAQTFLGATIGQVSGVAGAEARAFSALGIEAGAAAGRVEALTASVEGLGSAMAPLLLLGTGILAIGASVEFLKHGLDEAAHFEKAMVSLGVAVKNQGADWAGASAGVKDFLRAVEETTTFSSGEALAAMNNLVTSGTSVADSEKIIAIATDVAAAKGITLLDVIDRLKQAEAGRGRGLVQLDLNLKDVVSSHGHLSDALKILSRDFAGEAAAATDTYEGKQRQLKNTLDLLAREVGEHLVPAFAVGATVLLGVLRDLEQSHAIENFFERSNKAVQNALPWLDKAIAAYGFLNWVSSSTGDRLVAGAAAAAGRASGFSTSPIIRTRGAGGQILELPIEGDDSVPGEMSSRRHTAGPVPGGLTGKLADFWREGAKALDEYYKLLAKYRGASLSKDPVFGKEPGSGSGSSGVYNPADDFVFGPKASQYAQAAESVRAQLGGLAEQEKNAAVAIGLATTAGEKQNRELALAQQKTTDAKLAVVEYTDLLAREKSERERLVALLPQQAAAFEAARVAMDHEATTVGTNSVQFTTLRNAYNGTKAAATQTAASIEELDGLIDRNTSSLGEAKRGTLEYAIALGALSRATMDEYDAANKAYNKHVEDIEKRRTQREIDLANERATYNQSIGQQIAYYSRLYANEVAAHGNESELAIRYEEVIAKLEVDGYKKRVDAYDSFIGELRSKETQYLDELIGKNQSLRDALSNIWKDIEHSFVSMIEKTVVEGSLFGGLNNSLASAFGISSPMGGGASGSPKGTANDPVHVVTADAGGNYLYKTTGSSGGVPALQSVVAGGGAGGGGSIVSPGGLGAILAGIVGIGALASAGGSLGSKIGGGGGTAGGDLLGAAGGIAGLGGFMAATGGGFSSGLAALAAGGPIGWALLLGAAGIGLAAGGAFGPHWGPASNFPDRSDPNYGQFEADWQGTNGNVSNGVSYNAAQQYNVNAGGRPMWKVMEDWANSVKGSSSLTADQKSMLSTILGLENGNPDADLGVGSLHNGVWTLADGSTISYADAQKLSSMFGAESGASSGSILSLMRSYPDFNKAILAPAGLPSSASTSGMVGSLPGQVSPQGNVNYFDFRGAVGVPTDETIAKISQALRKSGSGQLLGASNRIIGPG